MDVFKQGPSIPDDTVQYTIYPPSAQSGRSSVTTYATCMRLFIEALLPNFLWHRDAIELKVVQNPDDEGWILEGRMRVGDCVDDEWCLVWLLKEISAKWDVVIRVSDSDGEFLLIEAAEALPAWVKPSNSENRVWIYGSRLHLIPLTHISPPSRKRQRRRTSNSYLSVDEEHGEEDDYLAAQDALEIVRNSLIPTFAPTGVEKMVWQRISGYPAVLKEHVHVTKAHLPIDVAKALSTNPSLVQKVVETFYTRDAVQLRAVHKMARFPPEPAIIRKVRMTRTAYAQLLGQRFHPPKIYGVWKEREGTPEWRWRDVGMKIACGFEMLFQESKSRKDFMNIDTKTSAEVRKEGLGRNPEYREYIRNLVDLNYFKGEREGSQLWTTLEDKAADLFVEVRRVEDSSRPSFATLVSSAISQATDVVVDESSETEDSDEWLDVDADDFEEMLEKTMGTPKDAAQDPLSMTQNNNSATEDRVASEQASKLRKLAQQVEDFVEGEGHLEGAMLEDDLFSDEELDNDESSDDDEPPQMDEHARQLAMAKLVPGLEPSEYGKMPASFHSNSQSVASVTMETTVQEGSAEKNIESQSRPIRGPILPRNEYDGVVSDDDTDEEGGGDGESDEEQPQVVGDVEIDMQEEEEEFLEFSRQALGITDEHWKDIIRDRQKRGAFLPASATADLQSTRTAGRAEQAPQSFPQDTKSQKPRRSSRHDTNPDLNSFEAVMQAMDAELARQKRGSKPGPPVHDKGKGKAETISEGQDIEAAMEAEFEALLKRGDENEDSDDEEPVDYKLIKNFLESFKSQGGLAGPVSSLAGRLEPGWKLPRDNA